MGKPKRHEALAWTHATLAAIPRDIIGVYAFWFRSTGKCIYVGESTKQTIKMRLHQHWRGSHSAKLQLWMQAYGEDLNVCYAPVARNRIKKLEQRLIERWIPEANDRHKPR